MEKDDLKVQMEGIKTSLIKKLKDQGIKTDKIQAEQEETEEPIVQVKVLSEKTKKSKKRQSFVPGVNFQDKFKNWLKEKQVKFDESSSVSRSQSGAGESFF